MKHGLICLVLLSALPPLCAQQVGDTVIVIAPSEAKLKMENRVVGVVPRGASLKIAEANKSGFRVVWKGPTGWIAKEDVLLPDKAIRLFSKAIEKKPLACDYFGRGNARLEKQQYDQAIVDYNEAIRLTPKYSEAYRRRGNAWYWKGDYDKACADYTEAIRINPRGSNAAYSSRGSAWTAKGLYDKAIADFTEAVRLDPKDAIAYHNRGHVYGEKGDFDRAIADYTRAIDLDPEDGASYSDRGGTWADKGDYDKAIADCAKAIRLDPKDSDAYFQRGNAWCKKACYDKAIADYNDALRLDAKNAMAYCGRSIAFYDMHDYAHAITDCTEAIRNNPKLCDAYYYRGSARYMKGNCDKAIADYTEAIRIDPARADAFCGRGMAYAREADFDKAIADYTEAIRLNDAYDDAYSERGWAYYKKGDYIRAIDDDTEVIRRDPKSANAYFNRAIVRYKQGDYKRAIPDYTKAIQLDPNDGDKYASRAWAYYKNGDRDLAIADCTKTVALCPDSSCVYEVRGALLVACGDYDGGIADIQKAIRLNSKDEAAKFETWRKTPLSADALRHGQRQLRNMLNDRKAMKKHGKLAEPLYQWAILKFAGEDLGEAVFWDAANSVPHLDSCNQAPTDEQPGSIWVREEHGDGPELGRQSFEELWFRAVFELYNVASASDFERLARRVHSGQVSRVQYVTEQIRIESHAAEKTRSFYVHVFLPWARKHKIATNPLLWYLAEKSDVSETLILDRVDKTGAYWLYYENGYDDIVAWAKAHKQEVKEEIEELSKQAAAERQKPAKGDGLTTVSGAKAHANVEPSAASNRIEPLDVLTVCASGTLLDQPIWGRFLVEPGGKVSLGPAYGRVDVKGLTIQEAEAAVKKHLETILRAPEVEVLAAGRATQWRGEPPKTPYHIHPNDLLKIRAIAVLLDRPIDGEFRVDPSGKVELGEPYGSVTVKGLALEEAERAIAERLRGILSPETGKAIDNELPGVGPEDGKASGVELPPGKRPVKPEVDRTIGTELPALAVNPQVSVTLTGWKREPKGSK